jgi:hypothetical protein
MELDYLGKIGQGQVKTGQKPRSFSLMWDLDLIQIQQYYKKWVMLREGHIKEKKSKKGKLRR